MNVENDRRIDKWYESKVVFLITVLSPVVLILMYIFGMKTDIALIQQNIQQINLNHAQHIQDLTQEMKDLNVEQANQQQEIIELQKQLIKVLDHLPSN